jgi:tRNA dimethylallyltransferase
VTDHDGDPLLAVVGPTGSGKSDLALALAEAFGGEIVNCDSVQLYRYMDVGTAKVPPDERRGIPHYLIDVLDPDQLFTAGNYIRTARPILREITARGRIPIVTGGTGFYFRALLYGLFEGPSRDQQLRTRLARRGPESLARLLRRLDARAAARIHPNDTQKIVRALEVRLLTRTPITSLFEKDGTPLRGFQTLTIGLDPDRELLADRIDARCLRMFENGLIDEARRIVAMGFPPTSKGLESIGYRESLLHIGGQISYEEAVTLTQAATRQYAKRQRTWFRREASVQPLHAFGNQIKTIENAKRLADSFLKNS